MHQSTNKFNLKDVLQMITVSVKIYYHLKVRSLKVFMVNQIQFIGCTYTYIYLIRVGYQCWLLWLHSAAVNASGALPSDRLYHCEM